MIEQNRIFRTIQAAIDCAQQLPSGGVLIVSPGPDSIYERVQPSPKEPFTGKSLPSYVPVHYRGAIERG